MQLLVGPYKRRQKSQKSIVDPTEPVDPENPDPEKPVKPIDPTDPEGPNPGTQGPLSIDYASSFDFGKNRISNKDQVYFARAQQYQENQKETPNFVQISDNRDAQNVVKPEATNKIALVPGTASLVAAAKQGTGAGTWATYWGKVEVVAERDETNTVHNVNVTKDVALSVPGSTPKDAVKYQTKLLWTYYSLRLLLAKRLVILRQISTKSIGK